MKINSQIVGLSLEEQADFMAESCVNGLCATRITLIDKCPFDYDCDMITNADWLEYLKNRQIPVNNPAK